MSIHEKTYELNITHEILTLGLAFFTHHYVRGVNIIHRLFWFTYPEYAIGYHINVEGPIGGYDVALRSGLPGHPNSKAIFLQYKAPKYKARRTAGSINFDTAHRATPHYQFIINDNGRQHAQLRHLSRLHLHGYTGNHVLYALPLVKNSTDFHAKLGRLIRFTKFITIRSIDHTASHQVRPVDLGYGKHSILIGEADHNIVEVKSDVMVLEEQDITGNVVAEIITAIISKNLNFFRLEINQLPFAIIGNAVKNTFFNYIAYLLEYFDVSADRLNEMGILSDELIKDLSGYISQRIPLLNNLNRERDIAMVKAIVYRLSLLLNAKNDFNIVSNIPYLADNYLLDINDNNNKISFEGVDTKSIEQISYLLI
jgi:hypothetical protein